MQGYESIGLRITDKPSLFQEEDAKHIYWRVIRLTPAKPDKQGTERTDNRYGFCCREADDGNRIELSATSHRLGNQVDLPAGRAEHCQLELLGEEL